MNNISIGSKIGHELLTLKDKVAAELDKRTRQGGITIATIKALKEGVPVATIMKNVAKFVEGNDAKSNQLAKIFEQLFNSAEDAAIKYLKMMAPALFGNTLSGLATNNNSEKVIIHNALAKLAAKNPKFAELLRQPDGYLKLGLPSFDEAQAILKSSQKSDKKDVSDSVVSKIAPKDKKEPVIGAGYNLTFASQIRGQKEVHAKGSNQKSSNANEIALETQLAKIIKMLGDATNAVLGNIDKSKVKVLAGASGAFKESYYALVELEKSVRSL